MAILNFTVLSVVIVGTLGKHTARDAGNELEANVGICSTCWFNAEAQEFYRKTGEDTWEAIQSAPTEELCSVECPAPMVCTVRYWQMEGLASSLNSENLEEYGCSSPADLCDKLTDSNCEKYVILVKLQPEVDIQDQDVVLPKATTNPPKEHEFTTRPTTEGADHVKFGGEPSSAPSVAITCPVCSQLEVLEIPKPTECSENESFEEACDETCYMMTWKSLSKPYFGCLNPVMVASLCEQPDCKFDKVNAEPTTSSLTTSASTHPNPDTTEKKVAPPTENTKDDNDTENDDDDDNNTNPDPEDQNNNVVEEEVTDNGGSGTVVPSVLVFIAMIQFTA